MQGSTQETASFRAGSVQPGAGRVDQPKVNPPDCRSGAGLTLDFRKAPLEAVLRYLHQSTGVIIHVRPDIQVERPVDLCHEQPVSAPDALRLLKQVLIQMGCTLTQKGGVLRVISSKDEKKHWISLPAI